MWIPLSEIDSPSVERIGNKALRLHEARARGLRIPRSYVLECEALAGVREDPRLADTLARELFDLLQGSERVLLRSSSPLEDRRDASAAGLLPTLTRATRVDAIADGLREMARATEAASLRTLLHTGEVPVPLAVLAQPRLALESWCTLEWNPLADRARIEGWQLDSCGDHPLRHEAIPLSRSDTLRESGVGVGALMNLARRAQEGSEGVWLLEMGIEAGEAVLLQRRPVREAAPGVGAPQNADDFDAWLEFPLFESDRCENWVWDAAHSPRPLAPLLASVFVEWIRERGEDHPSRIIDGRWHDRRGKSRGRTATEEGDAIALRHAVVDWHEKRVPALERGLELAELLAADCREYASWRLFLVAWLDWQTRYYDGGAGRLRALAAPFVPEPSASWHLPDTVARRRERALDSLARNWNQQDESEQAEALGEFLDEHGHHAPGGWDGYGVPWDEDPSPLLKELQARAKVAKHPVETASPDEGIERTPLPGEETPPAVWAAHALAALEDDDDLLAYAYALFRDAALNLEEQLYPDAAEGEILDILAPDLAHLEARSDADAWRRARARGVRLRACWMRALPSDAPPAGEGERLHGHPRLSEGETEGPVRILDSALQGGGPETGEILVVPTVLPGDALVFSRCAGIVCESGEPLGHAAVLAREAGLPALVLPRACSLLRGVERARLDASTGVVEVLARRKEA